ncbi:pyridoxal-dependent decarboxylase [Selenomonas sp. ND2010]|uniref:pyridoxal-dependent decarboxylase n=1 Tax=Selenomonas sp. ND2010 TaxID=1410618 RepID=UPI00051AB86D|nr:pyridoxal-dependent decarboxylase [Selenomonas sp. ND2010]
MTGLSIKTPYFLIDKTGLDSGLQKLKDALQNAWPNYIIGYSYKTNSLPWVINYFKKNNCYAEVVSDDEYELAKSIGIDNKNVIYNGIAKSKKSFLEAVRNHAIVNIDSEYEIDWLDDLAYQDRVQGEKYEVGIRVNFDLEAYCPGQTQCGEDGERFGFCYENGELQRAIDKIENKGIHVTGLHLHKSSKTRMPDIYESIAKVAVEITGKYDLSLSYIDIGGGFFGGLETKPQFPEYFNMVAGILAEQFDSDNTVLIVEPGMALIGSAVDYITSVVDVKKTMRNTFVITDGSRTQIDPLMTKSEYFYDLIMQNENRKNNTRQIVSGFTCMEHDRLFELNDGLELQPGDQIVYHKVGAYTMCLAPLFIKWYPDVYVKDGALINKVRNRWTDSNYKSGSIAE